MKSKVETKVLRSSMTHAGSTVKENVTTLTTPCATAMDKKGQKRYSEEASKV